MKRSARIAFSLLTVVAVADLAFAQPSETSRLHWVTNGSVRAATVHDQTLYIGGTFTRVAPATSFLGPWFTVSTTTGAAGPRLPLADAAVLAIEPDGAGGFFVGGRFTTIGGLRRAGLARVRADGSIDSVFTPALQPRFTVGVPEVRALARVGGLLYVGGDLRVDTGAVRREALAVLDAATGADVTSFPADLDGSTEQIVVHQGRVYAMGVGVTALDGTTGSRLWLSRVGPVSDGAIVDGRLVVGGRFVIGLIPQLRYLVRLDLASGAPDAGWSPILSFAYTDPHELFPIRAVTALGSTVYVGGRFTHLNGQPRAHLAAVDVTQATLTPWAPEAGGVVHDLTPASGTSMYVAGEYRRIAGVARDALAEIDITGSVAAWSPQAYSTAVRTLNRVGTTLMAGGHSAVAGGVAREHLAAFDLSTDEVLAWAPATSEVLDLATDGVTVFVGERISASQPWLPGVSAFDARTGALSSWRAPSNTHKLVGLADGHVYLLEFIQVGTFGTLALVRTDTETGAIDTSWRMDGNWDVRATFARGMVYLAGLGEFLNDGQRRLVAAVHRTTGDLSPWSPPLPWGTSVRALAVAFTGRTMFVAYEEGTLQSLAAVDLQNGIRMPFAPTTGMHVSDLAAADGLIIAVGVPQTLANPGALAFSPDGTHTLWNPGLAPTDPVGTTLRGWNRDHRWPVPEARVLVTSTDLVVAGMQSLGDTPVHGIAVYARQASAAPTALQAEVVDHDVRLSWTASDPPAGSYTLEAGSVPGASNLLVQDVGGTTTFHAVAPFGTYFVRVRATGAAPGAASVPTNEVALQVGCSAPPAPPTRLSAHVSHVTVNLTWQPPTFTAVARYVIEAGSDTGLTNLARLVLPATETSFTTDAPAGTYHVRIRAENACGTSGAASDVWFTVGGAPLPPAPTGLTITATTQGHPLSPRLYRVEWSPVPGALGYRLEVGSMAGLTDVVSTFVPGTSAGPAGAVFNRHHFVRVRAITAAGIGPPSAEYKLIAR